MIGKFFRGHPALRVVLILLTFAAGIALVIYGWGIKGKLSGLGLMLLGVALLLTTLAIYNSTFK